MVRMQPLPAQSHLRLPLNRLLANGGAVRVLRALCLYGGPLGTSQIAQETGMTPQGTRLAMETLLGLQIVRAIGQGRANLYEFDLRHPLAGALKNLFVAEKENWEALLQALRSVMGKFKAVVAAWYYGSVARGEDAPRSDFDLAVVVNGDVEAMVDALHEALHALEASMAVTFSVVGVALADVPGMASDNAWWQEMARDAKTLKGMPPDRLVQRLGKPA